MNVNVAVIIVNYGTPDLAIRAVESVLERTHGGRMVAVHLVDNASPNGDAAAFEAAHSDQNWGARVTLWLEGENHGFGRGNNRVLEALALSETPPDYAFLLNPDAQLENETIDILAKALEANPKAAAAGAGITNPDGRAAVAGFRFPSLTSELVSAINFGPIDKIFSGSRVSLPADMAEGPVDWVAGASVMMRFDVLQSVGFFDPDFFLYYEEVDLMRRLAKAGHQTLYVPSARILHIEGAATEVSSGDTRPKPKPVYLYESYRMYFEKAHGRTLALLIAFLKLPAAAFGALLARLRMRRSGLPLRFFRDHWTHVVRPLLTGGA